jgi:hypothetical protein
MATYLVEKRMRSASGRHTFIASSRNTFLSASSIGVINADALTRLIGGKLVVFLIILYSVYLLLSLSAAGSSSTTFSGSMGAWAQNHCRTALICGRRWAGRLRGHASRTALISNGCIGSTPTRRSKEFCEPSDSRGEHVRTKREIPLRTGIPVFGAAVGNSAACYSAQVKTSSETAI